jgi:ubiquinone/menaquinone biosynthesis C-methylase UbiE
MDAAAASRADFVIRSQAEVAETLRIAVDADRGIFGNKILLPINLALAVTLVARLWIAAAAIALILVADFLVFVIRRRRTLHAYNTGTPRLTTAADFHDAAAAFEAQGHEAPSMSDWERAAGFGDCPEWRISLRYREASAFYCGGKVADVGCGDGRLCWLHHICDAEHYYGIDNAEIVSVLSARTGGVAHAIAGTAENTTLPDESMDLIVCTEAFEHLTDPGIALREFCRILKPGGRIVIQSPSARQLRNLNPLHWLQTALGYWFPSLLQPTMVHANTFLRVYTYHWDFTRQDFQRYTRGLPLAIESMRGATYHFNPNGNLIHRLGYKVSGWPVINALWWDLTVVLRRSVHEK